MHAVFRPSQDGESENPRDADSDDALLIHTRHFLLVTFLCASKEKLPAHRAEALHFKCKGIQTTSVGAMNKAAAFSTPVNPF